MKLPPWFENNMLNAARIQNGDWKCGFNVGRATGFQRPRDVIDNAWTSKVRCNPQTAPDYISEIYRNFVGRPKQDWDRILSTLFETLTNQA